MVRKPPDKIVFLASLAALAWLYGFATSARQWYPNDLIVRAWDQAQAAWPFRPPVYLHERVYDREGVQIFEETAVQPGPVLVTSAWPSPEGPVPGLRLMDRRGTTLHEWQVDPADVFNAVSGGIRSGKDLDIQGSYLFPDGDVLVNLEYAGSVRLDACGRIRWRLRQGNHHAVARDDDGTFWIPAVTQQTSLTSPGHPDGFPGIQQPVYQDLILHVSADGTVLDTIHVLDVLYGNDLEAHLADEGQLEDDDPTHLNDVAPLADSLAAEYPLFETGDLLVSLRDLDLVLVFDPDSERVKWNASRPFLLQHDPDFIGGGWIGVFDNRWDGTDRGTMLGGSRIVALQPHTDSTKILYPTPRSDPFYTPHRGKWELLRNGNLLLTEEAAGRVVEAAPDGRAVWEWVAPPVDGSSVPSVTKAAHVNVTPASVAAWPCSPEDSVTTLQRSRS